MSSYIGRININNTEYPIAQSLFGTCNTTANTATKVVTCADFDTLISGIVINVYFTYANTESSISLNVNSTGNKTVYIDSNSSILWDAGATKSFVYYNNQWRLINPTSVGTTYSAATTAAAGLLSASDKAKLDRLDGQYVPVQHIGSISTATINYDSNIVKIGTHSTWSNIQQKLQVEQGEYPQIRIQQQYENNQIYSSITLDTHQGIYLNSDKNIYIGSNTTSGVEITQVKDPTNAQDAANKRYVDNSIASIPASTYAAGSGLSLSGTTFNHTNSITASSVGSSVATSGATLDIPYAKYDAQGHITAKGVHVHTIGSLAASAITSGTFATARIPSLPTSIITSGTFATARIPNLPTSIITSGTFSTARLPVSTSVGNDNNLPTGAAVQSYVTGLGYEANQNAFTTVKVGTTDLVADSKTDTLTITAGNNITLTPTASSDSFSIAATNTTYAIATTATEGLMSASDKIKLNGVPTSAFKTIKVGSTNLVADSAQDTLTITAGDNITLTPTASSDSFSISATNTTYGTVTSTTDGLMSAADKQTLDGLIAGGGQPNQNAFSNVVVGSSTVAADSKTDTLTLVGSGSVSLSANTSTDTITISGTNTTYAVATTAANGLMSSTDKQALSKWNGVALDKNSSSFVNETIYVPIVASTNSNQAYYTRATSTPTGYTIARYNGNGYLTSTTPATSTNSTVVATTQFVHNALAATPATTYSVATTAADGLMSATDKQTLDGLVASGGEVNQNAFSNVVIGSSTVAADSKTDTLTLAGANGISLSANTSTDTITIDGTKFVLKDATSATTGEGGTITNSTSGVLLSALGDTTDTSISVTKTSGGGITLKHQGTSSTSTILVKNGVSIDSNAAINIGTGSTGSVTITNLVTPTNNSDAATKAYVDNIISGGILKGIRINSSDSYVSSLGSNVYLITHNQGFAENFTSTVMVKDSSSSYFYQAINDDGVSLVYTNGKIRYDIFDIQENQFKIEFSSVPYQFSILINTNYDSLSLVDVDSTSTLLSI